MARWGKRQISKIHTDTSNARQVHMRIIQSDVQDFKINNIMATLLSDDSIVYKVFLLGSGNQAIKVDKNTTIQQFFDTLGDADGIMLSYSQVDQADYAISVFRQLEYVQILERSDDTTSSYHEASLYDAFATFAKHYGFYINKSANPPTVFLPLHSQILS